MSWGGRASETLRSLRLRLRLHRPPPPTSAAGVEMVVALGSAGARLATVLQMLPALPRGLSVSPAPGAYAALWFAAAATAVTVAAVNAIERRVLRTPGILADVALAVAFLVMGMVVVPAEERVGSWVGWAPGYALSVVVSLAGLRRGTGWTAAIGCITAGYLIFVADGATTANLPTIVGNALSLLVLGWVARVVVRYIRRVAADADAARARAAELARLDEEHRAQLTMHNATTIMQLLADPSLPDGIRGQLQDQAYAEVRRMRAYLRGRPDPLRPTGQDDAGCVPLREVLETAMAGFADLGLEPALDLVGEVTVAADAGAAIRGAVATVLHNVRRHACATMVVLHADADPEARRWIVTIRDNGAGFDVATTVLRTGLRQQVHAELERHGLTAQIDSMPGMGTRVTIEGRLDR